MESGMMELSKYRYERAKEAFTDAGMLLEQKRFAASVNRSYYAIFHALRAVTALDGFDSGKHSGVIAYINKMYVKEGIFDRQLSKILDTAFRLREKADYDDFFVVSAEEAKQQLAKADTVMHMLLPYLEGRWNREI